MAFNQRLSSRFFAAFYTWNRLVVNCALSRQHALHRYRLNSRTAILGRRRTFTTSIVRHDSEQPQQQDRRDDDRTFFDVLLEEQDKDLGVDKEGKQAGSNQLREEAAQELEQDQQEEGIASSGDHINKGALGMGFAQDSVPTRSKDNLPESVRLLMREVPYPVVVVTASHVLPDSNAPVGLGSALSSFNTVTLDPPTVSFNVRQPSQTLDAIRADSGRFRIHILHSNELGARVAETFTRGNHDAAFLTRAELAPKVTSSTVLQDEKSLDRSVAAALDCTLSQEIPVGDHVVAVGHVSRVVNRQSPLFPLVYARKSYLDVNLKPIFAHDQPTAQKEGVLDNERGTDESPEERLQYPTYTSLALFPGEAERKKFGKTIAAYVKRRPDLGSMSLTNAEKEVCGHFLLPQGGLGISVVAIIARTIDHSNVPAHVKEAPVFYDFWGRPNPEDITAMSNRLKKLVEQDPAYLALDYKSLFDLIGAYWNMDVLASQLLEPLRVNGFIPPFQPQEDGPMPPNGAPLTLELLEQIDHRLRELLKRSSPSHNASIKIEELLESLQTSNIAKPYVLMARRILHVETAPEFFLHDKVDITGTVDEYAARVVVYRVTSWYHQYPRSFYSNKDRRLNFALILRRLKIHPLITGINLEFLYQKINHIFRGEYDEERIRKALIELRHEILNVPPNFSSLTNGIRRLVERAPLRAVTWAEHEIAAAIGIVPESTLHNPGAGNEADGPVAMRGRITGLLSKYLRKVYSVGNSAVDPAITSFLEKWQHRGALKEFKIRKHASGKNAEPARSVSTLNSEAGDSIPVATTPRSQVPRPGTTGMEKKGFGSHAYRLDGKRKV